MARTKKVETITKISPHTVKKFELIEKYVDEWARKILGIKGVNGMPGSKGVIYIDCMCNSGLYEVDGNIVEGTALRVAKKLNEIISNYPGKEATILSETKIYSTSYAFSKFNCSAGDIIVISMCRYNINYSSIAYFYFKGFGAATSTAVSGATSYSELEYSEGSTAVITATYNAEFDLPELTREGYTFLGWYNGNTKVESGKWKYTENITLTPKWA